MVRIMAQVNESGAGLDVIWKDLAIAAEALPGFADGIAPEPPRRSWLWGLLGGLAGVTALAVGIWWSGSRRARATPGAKARVR